MKVAILYSGGKDSSYAVQYAKEKGWDIKYLLSVKPTRTDCYLFHFATVEHTKELADILNIPHILETCDVADPKKEAEIVKRVVENNMVDAVVLGGTGLQETQIRSIQEALMPLGVEAFASHAGMDHDEVMQEMVNKGYKIMITQIASMGLDKSWLGRIVDKETLRELFERSTKFGFHCGGEGGYYDTLVVDGPIFDKRLEIIEAEPSMESEYAGHLVVTELKVMPKAQTNLGKKQK